MDMQTGGTAVQIRGTDPSGLDHGDREGGGPDKIKAAQLSLSLATCVV